ncbi:triphosphoribosyl-dephospho-CoA synthase [Xanthobacter sp. V3C-3]|uniref:triphosphoribosyl-dephospho-CoA synthase n=1 Tax=Xanthobacter lutulentifluminis TaxID=3119935 RepID=UPI0037271D18
MSALAPGRIARAFEAACRAELAALKPGNVHVHAAGHGMEVAQFEQAAAAAAPAIARAGARAGMRIREAVEASLAVAGCNTNLGIILLCAPLAAAAEAPGPGDLRVRLAAVLAELDVDDARDAFCAIAAASPGGLGDAPEADVRAPAAITLAAAMALTADRDRIARQYATVYADIFALGLPALRTESGDGRAGAPHATAHVPTGRAPAEPGTETAEPPPAGTACLAPARVEAAYLAFLSAFPDSHIARKFGPQAAEAVRAEAEAIRTALPALAPAARHARLMAFDAALKARGLNPGTSADLTVASVFAALLEADGA